MKRTGLTLFLVKLMAILAVAGLLWSMFAVAAQAATNPNLSAIYESSLQSRISSTDTSLSLVSNSVNTAGEVIPNGYTCFTIDGNTASVEYVCGTVSGKNVTSLVRGISFLTGTTTVSGLAQSHARGADVRINDYPALVIINNQLHGVDTITAPLLYDPSVSTGSFSSAQQVPSKGYVDGIAFSGAGAIAASTAAKGYVQIATGAQAASSATTGTTGAILVIPSSLATSTRNAATSMNVVPVTGADSKIDNNFIATSTTGTQTGLFATSSIYASPSSIGYVGKNTQVFSTTGTSTFAVPQGVTAVWVETQAAGGGASGANGSNGFGNGGPAGGYAFKTVNVSATTSVQVFVGSGGGGGTGASNGGAGQWSTFGTNGFYFYANGGSGGNVFTNAPLGIPGCGVGGDFNSCGSGGTSGIPNGTSSIGGSGGSSRLGGGAASTGEGGGTGDAGKNYGGGGGGTAVASGSGTGGAGAQGVVIVHW